jgi:hypothetical protein
MTAASRSLATAQSRARFASGLLQPSYTTSWDTISVIILPQLDERQRRLFAASEARAAGHGGIAAVSRVTRIAASTIGRGLKDLGAPPPPKVSGVRRRATRETG